MSLTFTRFFSLLIGAFLLLNPLLFNNKVHAQNNFFACGTQTGYWNYDTVFVECDVFVPQNETLVIAEGTRVVFLDHYAFNIEGAIQALGSEMLPVSFTVADTAGFGNIHSTDGGWAGIRFTNISNRSDSSIFQHCQFSYGKAVVDSVFRYGGAIAIRDYDKIRFSDCHFHRNYAFYRGGAIYAEKSDMLITRCLFTANHAGNDSLVYGYGGALKLVSCGAHVLFSEFYENSSTGVGGALSVEFGDPLLQNCIFTDNQSYIGGAICYLRTTPSNINANILVANNYAETFGGGIACITAAPMFSNTTIANNEAAMGGGLYCSFDASPKLFNSIIWGNETYGFVPGSQVWIWDIESVPAFYNCAVQYGVAEFGGSGNMFEGPYVDCHEEDPMFADAMQSGFNLLEGSPCINTGMEDVSGLNLPPHDLAMNARISGGRIDMGAYEFQEAVAVNSHQLNTSALMVQPNPISSESKLVFSLQQTSQVGIYLHNLQGKCLFERQLGTIEAGMQQLLLSDLFSPETLAPGLYLIGLQTDYQQYWFKVVR